MDVVVFLSVLSEFSVNTVSFILSHPFMSGTMITVTLMKGLSVGVV